MKIRNGFVSNSSSSSFVLGKYFMTPEQIKELSDLISTIYEVRDNGYDSPVNVIYENMIVVNDEDTALGEDENYFYGDIGQGHDMLIVNFLKKYPSLDGKYIFEG